MKILNHIVAAAAFALVATAASAQMVPGRAEVRYGDLNLATAAGQAVLASRIDIAARQVCGVDANERDLKLTAHARTCHADSVSRAKLAVASGEQLVFVSR